MEFRCMPRIEDLPDADLDDVTGDEVLLMVQAGETRKVAIKDLWARRRPRLVTVSGSTPTRQELDVIFSPTKPMDILVVTPDHWIHRCVWFSNEWYISAFARLT